MQISQEAGRVVWYSHLLKNFPVCCDLHRFLPKPVLNFHYISASASINIHGITLYEFLNFLFFKECFCYYDLSVSSSFFNIYLFECAKSQVQHVGSLAAP